VARWKGGTPQRVEAPSWYRCYDPAAWDEPDAQEITMTAGWTGPVPAELRDYHARRRWEEARYAYRREHPLLAEQELGDLMNRRAARRDMPGS
jgi:hypothetical protein